ncbi:MAG TPA: hypothetical protein VM487_21030 [Phycisphaerae bacterium]|nr:hypothetical protein [Phycisphaerae bacterium]
MPVTKSINKPSGSDYVDAASFIAAAKVAGDAWTGECYHDGVDGNCGGFTVLAGTWTNPNKVTLTAAPGCGHATKGRTTAYWDAQGIAYLGRIDIQPVGAIDFDIDGPVIVDATNTPLFIFNTRMGIIADCLIVCGSSNVAHKCLDVSWLTGGFNWSDVTIRNCAIHRFGGTANDYAVVTSGHPFGSASNRLTLQDCSITTADGGAYARAVRQITAQGSVIATGCIGICEAGGAVPAWAAPTAPAVLTCDHCADKDNSAQTSGGDANNVTSATAWADWFVDPDDDWHVDEVTGIALKAGTPIVGVTTDIDGQTRDAVTPWIGCDEITGGVGRLVNQTPLTSCVDGRLHS